MRTEGGGLKAWCLKQKILIVGTKKRPLEGVLLFLPRTSLGRSARFEAERCQQIVANGRPIITAACVGAVFFKH
jgi:hypothetical protein